MAIDITIEAQHTSVLSFDEFTREQLPLVARCVQLLANDPERANTALTNGTASVFHDWPQQQSFEQAQQHVFRQATRHCREKAASQRDANDVNQTAIAMAHHVFSWTAAETIDVLGVSADDLFQHVGDNQVGEQLRDQIDQVEPARVDLEALISRPDTSKRRPMAMVIGTIAALLLLGVLAQFAASPLRTKHVQGMPIIGEPPERLISPGEDIDLEPSVPMTERSMLPTIITSGRSEGFVGVQPPSGPADEAVFMTSLDGVSWDRVGSWDLDSTATISRFERIGNHFVVWLEEEEPHPNVGSWSTVQLAVSNDLGSWTVLDVRRDESAPLGRLHQSQITDVALNGDVVLAVVTTQVKPDFSEIPRYIRDRNRQVEQLTSPNELVVSFDGQPFEDAVAPFGSATQPQLTAVGDVFTIADSTGIAFATTTDAQTWQVGAAQLPPFPVQLSVTNHSGQVLGMGHAATGEPMLFFNNGPNTTSARLRQIIAGATSDAKVIVSSTPTRWALYVYEPEGPAWIAASDDGLNWNVIDAKTPDGNNVRVVASDDTAIIQTVNDGETSTMTIPLPGA